MAAPPTKTVGTVSLPSLAARTRADAAGSRALIEPLAEAGATWWDERQLIRGKDFYRLEPVLRRIEQGPPSLS